MSDNVHPRLVSVLQDEELSIIEETVPDFVLEHVFFFVNPRGLLCARLVNRRWRRVASMPSLWNDYRAAISCSPRAEHLAVMRPPLHPAFIRAAARKLVISSGVGDWLSANMVMARIRGFEQLRSIEVRCNRRPDIVSALLEQELPATCTELSFVAGTHFPKNAVRDFLASDRAARITKFTALPGGKVTSDYGLATLTQIRCIPTLRELSISADMLALPGVSDPATPLATGLMDLAVYGTGAYETINLLYVANFRAIKSLLLYRFADPILAAAPAVCALRALTSLEFRFCFWEHAAQEIGALGVARTTLAANCRLLDTLIFEKCLLPEDLAVAALDAFGAGGGLRHLTMGEVEPLGPALREGVSKVGPRLSSLHLAGYYFHGLVTSPPVFSSLPFSLLTVLEIDKKNPMEALFPPSFFDPANFPRLETLVLNGCRAKEEAAAASRLITPRLRRVDVCDTDACDEAILDPAMVGLTVITVRRSFLDILNRRPRALPNLQVLRFAVHVDDPCPELAQLRAARPKIEVQPHRYRREPKAN
jgi:hypothetical protein